ncbi:RNA 3'-terminal phosphate cyclase [Pseudoduganella albidiflava]|uniref:RNA 3'-terminal phosphate cyclase n=1 Tax=Pseudoduganella albidiflava TaxID=321983 RepID=A0A411X773_9BURK|nr:RNA 3'-terminal phosphate cyclase [Pseudoduganella albidiflava]QBI04703.1 RNA 3'-terminal phosphate cyclase [Pseudoduganella albidiflava]GGY70713.1 RNA 3'-terminal phosphate cyclase [Pseudoduganella albidiflava]
MIEIDGSLGEGGGQIVRSALTLSMVTGQPFRIRNIRAGRPRPGLMRQHVAAVNAAARVAAAETGPVAVGGNELCFVPRTLRGGDYEFAIGSAGSSSLVLQTLLPALLHAREPSSIRITGGTHNPMAPPVEFLQRAYRPLLERMGANFAIDLLRHGFYPAGGGMVEARVSPVEAWRPVDLLERGDRKGGYAESVIAGVHQSVLTRELECVRTAMGWTEEQMKPVALPDSHGPGNVLLLTVEHDHVTEVFTAFGEKMLRAEAVAKRAVQEARRYLASGAAVGEYLGDQLMLPMALAGGGSFSVERVSQHARTNADIISLFLPVTFRFEQRDRHAVCTVERRA